MAKAIVVKTSDIAWDSTNGFSFGVNYAVDSTNSSNVGVSVFLGLTSPSQDATVKTAIRSAVVSSALSTFSLSLSSDDVIILF